VVGIEADGSEGAEEVSEREKIKEKREMSKDVAISGALRFSLSSFLFPLSKPGNP
jgi:hypothetical protein